MNYTEYLQSKLRKHLASYSLAINRKEFSDFKPFRLFHKGLFVTEFNTLDEAIAEAKFIIDLDSLKPHLRG